MKCGEMLPRYTKTEELWNAGSHAAGAAVALLGTVLLAREAALRSDALGVISVIVFGITMVLLYGMSATYHGVTNPRLKGVMQVCDHCSIFLLIAGSYTPFTLIVLRGTLGYVLCSIVWIAGVVGIALNIFDMKRFEKLSMVCYIAMGWVVVLAVKPLVMAMTPLELGLLIVGGLSYTIGIVFYKKKHVRYMHSIWHFFVLGGTVAQYFSIYAYILGM